MPSILILDECFYKITKTKKIYEFSFTGGGLMIGLAMSVIFFKRRPWPALLGTGFGIGVAYRTCEKEVNLFK